MKNQGKYIVMIKDQKKKSVERFSSEFEVSVTSSEDLSSKNRAFNIIDKDNSVLFKNLNVAVLENIDEKALLEAVNDKNSPVIYYEKERDFFPANEVTLIKELKKTSTELREKITELEAFLLNKPLPQNPITDMEWGLKAIGLDQTQLTGKGVNICILDTGFMSNHPDFVGRDIEGKSFIKDEDWSNDAHGHGTHCVGVAAGNVRSDTGKRYGIAKEAHIKVGKVLSNSGKGSTSAIIDAINWAITKKSQIISMSLASPVEINEAPSLLFESVGKKAMENNCLIVAAAGNDSNRPSVPKPVSAPANVASIMAIAAIDSQMRVAKFSNGGINASNGGNVDFCAPGVDVLSSFPVSMYKLMNGTSMATPHVSGLLALYFEKFPSKSAKEIWDLLVEKSKKIDGLKYRDIGNGLVQSI